MGSPLFIALYWLIVLSIVLVIIAENRNPLKTVPWIVIVLLLPVVGIVLYIFFGEDLRHVRIIDRRVYSRITYIPFVMQRRLLAQHSKEEYKTPLRRIVKEVANSPLLPITSLSIYTTGEEKFSALIEDLKAANHHIHMEYYSFMNDTIATTIAEILKEKAKNGIRVRVIYDDVGSWRTKKKFWRALRKAGVETYPFMRVFFPLLSSRVNYRNHRKLVVIDGKIGYFGGMNVADKYIQGDKLGPWRDTHFRITGGAVYLLQSLFILDWHMVSQCVLTVRDYFAPIQKNETDVPSNPPLMQLIAGEPVGKWRTIEQAITTLIMNAKERIDIETPYLLPTNNLNNALITAALSGVKVRLLIPSKSDVPTVHLASLSYLGDLMDAGIEIYTYEKGFLHSKMIVVDGKVTASGSANLDFRSFEHNFELLALLYDTNTASKLEQIFERDLQNSKKVDPQSWGKRPFTKRFVESVMRLFSPLL